MKRILILTILLMSSLAWAGSTTVVVGQGAGGGPAISDDFSSDTSANYTAVTENSGISISGGLAYGSNNWNENIVYHETSLGSPNHWAQADIMRVSTSVSGSGLVIRCDGTGGYKIFVGLDGSLNLNRNSDWLTRWEGPLVVDTAYTVKATITGTGTSTRIIVTVDGTERIDYTDNSASALSTGNYIGLCWGRIDGSNPPADNLSADEN